MATINIDLKEDVRRKLNIKCELLGITQIEYITNLINEDTKSLKDIFKNGKN